ncbi:MAG TPA: arylsulfatase [Tepidisphaeraceae bacterium]|nr:arylsulfatase [Tepidisphaeraceae bacterium]
MRMPIVSICVALGVVLASGTISRANAAPAPRPNIVILLADDVGFCDIGCYGSEIHTPNLDALSADGLRFTQFYNVSRCCPSRACLLTGLYPHQTGVGDMTDRWSPVYDDGYVRDLNEHCVTIGQVLKSAGYGTYAVGKWHVTQEIEPNTKNKRNWPLHRGFDRYYGTIMGAGSFFDPAMLCRGDTPISPFVDPKYRPPAGQPYYYTDAIGDQACRFIREHHDQHGDQPFFLYVAFTAAHWPMQALPEDIAKYKGVYDAGYEPIRKARFEREKRMGLIDPSWELSPQYGNWAKVRNKQWEIRCMEVYAAMLDRMDQNIGSIVQTLRDQHLIGNTLILYLQDNGGNWERMGRNPRVHRTRSDHPTLPSLSLEHIQAEMRPTQTRDGWPVLDGHNVLPGPADTYIAYGQAWANVSNTPFREYKHWVHEGGISTPLIAHWPNGIGRKGELEKQPGHLIDLMATCVDLAGATYPKQFDGHDIDPMEGTSLLPAFAGKTLPQRSIFWEHEGNRAMRQGDYKLVAKGPGGKWELYDIPRDRTEMHDLASAQPQRVRSMVRQWEDWARRCHVIPWPWKPQYHEQN